MKTKTPPQGPGVSRWGQLREILESLEQAAAEGWYPARREFLSRLAQTPELSLPVWVPEADVEETPGGFVVTVALPGVDKADIRLEATEEGLVVSGRLRKDERAPSPCRLERPRGEFLRRVRLPAEIKPASAKASYRNGVLRVEAARARPNRGRSVKVE